MIGLIRTMLCTRISGGTSVFVQSYQTSSAYAFLQELICLQLAKFLSMVKARG